MDPDADDEHNQNAQHVDHSAEDAAIKNAKKMQFKALDETAPNAYKEDDQRRNTILKQMQDRMENSAKTYLQQAEENKKGVEAQLEFSQKKLQELITFGYELVSNIKVANEKREMFRIQNNVNQIQKLKEELINESNLNLAEFNDITAKWSELQTLKEPIELHERIEEQKESLAALFQKKDNIIETCQQEINRLSNLYNQDQEKQSNDIYCLVERVDNQIELIKEAYNAHFKLLHNNIEDERANLELTAANKWNEIYEGMLTNETEKLEIIKEKEIFYSREILRIRNEQEEITRSSRIRLEKDAELLQWELLNSKNIVLMISEKLDYNYQVLQRRNEENVIINNQQKRRVSRLSGNISQIKKKIHDTATKNENNIQRLSSEIQKLHASISDLEQKSFKFHRNNEVKFQRISNINTQEIQSMYLKIFQIEKVLYEQQLALPWIKPQIALELEALAESTSQESVALSNSDIMLQHKKHTKHDVQIKNPNTRVLRNILHKISDRAGFLIEEKLLDVLRPYSEEQQCLVRLQNIFAALRIKEFDNVMRLETVFRPYCYCPNCTEYQLPDQLRTMFALDDSLALTPHVTNSAQHKSMMRKSVCSEDECENHYLVIEPALVLTALKEFTGLQTVKEKRKSMQSTFHVADRMGYDYTNAQSVWDKCFECVPAEKEKLWKSLEHGLTHYLEVLKQREQLDNECKFLRKQNVEFMHLFQKFNL